MGEAKPEEAKPEAKADEKVEEKKEEKVEEKKEEEKKEEKKGEKEEGKKEEGEKKDEEKKEEEKKEEEKKEEEAKPPPPPPIVILHIDMHCVGCAKKIQRCLLKCKGVEAVETDMALNEAKIKGVVDPQALCASIEKKTMRKAKVISPVLPPPDEAEPPAPQVIASQVSGVITVELHVNMHCEACAQQLRKRILKLRGVQTVETELHSGKVMVTGTMTGEKLVDYIYRRTGKLAKIIPPPPPPAPEEEKKEDGDKPPEGKKEESEKKEDEKKEENAEKKEEEEVKKEGELNQANMIYYGPDQDMMRRMMYWNNPGGYVNYNHSNYNNYNMIGGGQEDYYNYYGRRNPTVPWGMPVYTVERPPPPPQFFSDENPNACCIS